MRFISVREFSVCPPFRMEAMGCPSIYANHYHVATRRIEITIRWDYLCRTYIHTNSADSRRIEYIIKMEDNETLREWSEMPYSHVDSFVFKILRTGCRYQLTRTALTLIAWEASLISRLTLRITHIDLMKNISVSLTISGTFQLSPFVRCHVD